MARIAIEMREMTARRCILGVAIEVGLGYDLSETTGLGKWMVIDLGLLSNISNSENVLGEIYGKYSFLYGNVGPLSNDPSATGSLSNFYINLIQVRLCFICAGT